MRITHLSFHEICAIIRSKPPDEEVNHIINQMIPNVWFERYPPSHKKKVYKKMMVTTADAVQL